ncbi:unnamed protein product [Tetraodon nigroviridis]|uniref:(spotted green pufferfish) hypothetical protein n=1 Tax=Tetraodon nigroviridis TaxID=99883 RepID=Q4RYF9_TETNG|nr:unnamed protein product [Tetraodon nigroviridis]
MAPLSGQPMLELLPAGLPQPPTASAQPAATAALNLETLRNSEERLSQSGDGTQTQTQSELACACSMLRRDAVAGLDTERNNVASVSTKEEDEGGEDGGCGRLNSLGCVPSLS